MKTWLRRVQIFVIIFAITLALLAGLMYLIGFFYPQLGMQWAVTSCVAFSCGLYVSAHVQ